MLITPVNILPDSHVRRLMNEKQLADEDLRQAKAYHHQRVTGILMQCKYSYLVLAVCQQ